jgi:DNA repair photolyase
MLAGRSSLRGRGAADNPANRFVPLRLERDADWDPTEDPAPTTQFFEDTSCSVISRNDSPDISYDAGLNPYRGCEHGCIYCYARPTHEYLGFSCGLDFETRIMVKRRAPELLRQELASPKWRPQVIALSSATDCYQPIERRLQLTRRCLEVLAEFRNPVSITTKSHLVLRDLDLLRELARHGTVSVQISVTTLDADLARQLEPRASSPARRLAAIEGLSAAGIPVTVLASPVIPALTDHEIPAILAAAARAGAHSAGYSVIRLPYGLADLFRDWLERHFPDRRDKVLNRIRAMRGGKLNESRFFSRMEGHGLFAEQIAKVFKVARRKAGLDRDGPELSTAAFRRPEGGQLGLFD